MQTSTTFSDILTHYQALKGELTVFVSDSGVGKSSMVHQIALANEARGLRVRFYSNEETPDDLQDRVRSRFTGIGLDRLAEHREMGHVLTQDEKEVLRHFENWYHTFPGEIVYVRASGMSGEAIKQDAIAKELQLRQTGQGYDLIIIDYIQRMARPDHLGLEDHYWKRTAANVAALSELAQELAVPVIATSQVSERKFRNSSQRIEPELDNLEDRRTFEQHAGLVVGIWRDPIHSEGRETYLKILKSNTGPVGEKILLDFVPGRYYFRPDNLQERWEAGLAVAE
jgi:replicative DNA helicase